MDVNRICPDCGENLSISPEMILIQCPKCKNTWLDVEGISPLEVFDRYLNEIRHPFSTIKGIAELLITGQVTVEEQFQWLTRISQTMDQMEELRLVVSKYVAKARKKP